MTAIGLKATSGRVTRHYRATCSIHYAYGSYERTCLGAAIHAGDLIKQVK